jgi:excisionase family DNA binding protein
MKTEETQTILGKLRRLERLLKASNELAMSISKAANYSGLSKSYLYKLTSSKVIPHYKPQGKLVYFRKSELDKYLFQNKILTLAEIENKSTRIFSRLKR